MMKLGRVLIARGEEAWLSDHCANLSRCPTLPQFDKLIANKREKLVGLDLIVLPTGWWQPVHAEIWGQQKTRPAIIAVSNYLRDTAPFIMDCVASLRTNDDCVPTDYSADELLARIEAIRRRVVLNAPMTSKVSALGGRVVVDLCESTIHVDGVNRTKVFTPMERALIRVMANKAGYTIPKAALCESVMSLEKMETLSDCLKHIDVYVCKIRRKLGTFGVPGEKIIGTFWRRGYAFDDPSPPRDPNSYQSEYARRMRERRQRANQLESVA